MALSVFDDRSHRPSADEIAEALGASARLWEQLISDVEAAYPPVDRVWDYSGARYGWSLRLKRRDRILLYLTPQDGEFLLGVVLGEKAALAAHEAGLPEPVLDLIDQAPRYAEGRGVRTPVSAQADLDAALLLAALKMGN